jgi:hypothetical protein
MRVVPLLLSTWAASLLIVAGATAQTVPPAPQPAPAPARVAPSQGSDISVTDSPGAVTAQNLNVQQMIIYQEARRDPVTRQFVIALRQHVHTMMNQGSQAEGASVYYFALDTGPSRPNEVSNIYTLVAREDANEMFGSGAVSCEIDQDVSVTGYVTRASFEHGSVTTQVHLLSHDDEPLLQRVCRGLRMRVSALLGPARGGSEDDSPTVYEYLKGTNNAVVLLLFPAETRGISLEESFFQYYWTKPLAFRYHHLPNGLTPEVFNQVNAFQRGETLTGHYAWSGGLVTSLSSIPEARREFGSRLDRLDSDWADYLRTAMVTIRDQPHPLMANGRFAHVLPRFRPEEVGSTEFWRAANDLTTAMDQGNCIAQQFLVDREYVAPEDAPFMERCALADIRSPR